MTPLTARQGWVLDRLRENGQAAIRFDKLFRRFELVEGERRQNVSSATFRHLVGELARTDENGRYRYFRPKS